jgi:hypothetical protein
VVSKALPAGKYTLADLNPDWDHQKFRVIVPCVGTREYHWCRETTLATLGHLLLILGRTYSAAQIYYFYRTLRIVSVRRRKDISGASRDNALPIEGSHAAGACASSVKRKFASIKTQLVEGYATLHRLEGGA